MNPLAPSEQASAFLRLPVETRLHLYSYLIPKKVLDIDLCRRRDEPHNLPRRKRSVISSLVAQTLELETISRSNGLHLLLVSSRTRDEVLPLLSRLTVRFHCPRCFDEWLRSVSYGLGVGVKWMKHVEIVFDCVSGLRDSHTHRWTTTDLARFMVTEAMQAAQHSVWLYYGRLDLTGQEKWKFAPVDKDGNPVDLSTQIQEPATHHYQNPIPVPPPNPLVALTHHFPPTTTHSHMPLHMTATGHANGLATQHHPGPDHNHHHHHGHAHHLSLHQPQLQLQAQRGNAPHSRWLISGWFDI